MRYTASMLLVLVVLLPCFITAFNGPTQGPQTIPGSRGPAATDVNLTVNYPYPDMYVNKSHGLIVNVTISNCGVLSVNGSFNVTLHITNKAYPLHKFSDMQNVTELGKPGNSTTFCFKNWSAYLTAGDFLLNVTADLPGDLVKNNNTVKFDIHVKPDAQPTKMELESAKVLPSKGTVATNFNFSVTYNYDYLPDSINITLDGVVHNLSSSDPSDLNATDGKEYYYSTKLAIRDLHSFYFQAAWGNVSAQTVPLSAPWVNYTAQNVKVTPEKGNITDLYNFTLTYGDYNNNAPLLKVVIGTYEFPFHPINPLDTDYSDANNNFYCKVYGYQIGIGPKTWSISLQNPTDTVLIGPFNFTGASNETGFLKGQVIGADDFPLWDVQVTLSPLGYSTTTDGAGDYQFEVPTGHNYHVLFSKAGYYNSTCMDIDIHKDHISYANATLNPLPVGGSVEGWVIDSLKKTPISGVLMQLKTLQGTLSATGDQSGYFKFTGVPAQTDANLSALPENHIGRSALVDIFELKTTQVNFTLTEKAPPFGVTPVNNTVDISVGTRFLLDFKEAMNATTLNVTLLLAGATLQNVSIAYDADSRRATVTPEVPLRYNSDYTLMLRKGLLSALGRSVLWRDFAMFYKTTYKPLGNYSTFPANNQDNVPLNVTVTIHLDVMVKNETITIVMQRTEGLSVSGEVSLEYLIPANSTDGSSLISFKPFKDLAYNTIYTVKLKDLLTDQLGHPMLDEDMVWFFKTQGKADTDGDGVPDEVDEFPNDPNEWKDSDKDGHGDVGDAFPNDKSEWKDSDNDGIGDNADPDRDGDGMPNDWETAHGLNASDPSDAASDKDGDGFTNLDEYYKGTNPDDPQDYPKEDNTGKGTPVNTYLIMIAIAVVIAIIAIAVIFFVNKSRHDLTTAESTPPEVEAQESEPSKETLQERTEEEEEVVSEANGDAPEEEKAFEDDEHGAGKEDGPKEEMGAVGEKGSEGSAPENKDGDGSKDADTPENRKEGDT